MGLEFYNLSHRFGYQSLNWPYFEDVKIERIHYHAKSGVLSQRITTSMHNTTHIDEVVQLVAFAQRKPLRHRLNALAIARTDQSRHVERAHLSPCLVTQPIQKRLEPTAKLVSPIRRSANHGRPLQKADHP